MRRARIRCGRRIIAYYWDDSLLLSERLGKFGTPTTRPQLVRPWVGGRGRCKMQGVNSHSPLARIATLWSRAVRKPTATLTPIPEMISKATGSVFAISFISIPSLIDFRACTVISAFRNSVSHQRMSAVKMEVLEPIATVSMPRPTPSSDGTAPQRAVILPFLPLPCQHRAYPM